MIIFWTSRWFIVADRLYRGGKPFSKSKLWLFFEHLVDILVLPLEDRGGLSLLRPLVCSSTKKNKWSSDFNLENNCQEFFYSLHLQKGIAKLQHYQVSLIIEIEYQSNFWDLAIWETTRNISFKITLSWDFFSNFPDFISMCTSCQ